MSSEKPPEIRATHLARKAIVYVRQSTELQVAQNQGSAEYQRGQAQHAERWGWPPEQIEIIDEDLGLSGSATAHRAATVDSSRRYARASSGPSPSQTSRGSGARRSPGTSC